MKDYRQFLFEAKEHNSPLQIVLRGIPSLAYKKGWKEDKTSLDLMNAIQDKYVRLVLIKTDDTYNTYDSLPDSSKNKIDYNYPILNMTPIKSKYFTKNLKIYNKVEDFAICSDKVQFHKEFKDSSFVPKTVFSVDEVNELEFPIIGKPKDGYSGQGIEIFKSQKDLDKTKLKFDVISEAKDLTTEFRGFVLMGKMFHLVERITNMKSKQSVGNKKPNDMVDFIYVDQDKENFKYKKQSQKIVDELNKKVKLDFYAVDFMLDSKDNVWVAEINAAPGLFPTTLIELYKLWCKEIYDKDISKEDEINLKDISDRHIDYIKTEFPKEYKSSLNPKIYK